MVGVRLPCWPLPLPGPSSSALPGNKTLRPLVWLDEEGAAHFGMHCQVSCTLVSISLITHAQASGGVLDLCGLFQSRLHVLLLLLLILAVNTYC